MIEYFSSMLNVEYINGISILKRNRFAFLARNESKTVENRLFNVEMTALFTTFLAFNLICLLTFFLFKMFIYCLLPFVSSVIFYGFPIFPFLATAFTTAL